MSLQNYLRVRQQIIETALAAGRNPAEITLVAVTKGVPWKAASCLYEAGQRHFGESRLDEALTKIAEAPSDCIWHLIGTLQRNKARKAFSKFALIHSVHSLELAEKLSALALELDHTCAILLQVNCSGEKSKRGFSPHEIRQQFGRLQGLPGLCLQGVMTMAPLTEDKSLIRSCFSELRSLRDELKSGAEGQHPMDDLSMGMSQDFPLAIQEGATILRIGSALFV